MPAIFSGQKVNALLSTLDAALMCWLAAFEGWAQRQPRWRVALLVGVIAWGLSIFLYAPRLWLLGEAPRLADFLAMCRNPLERNLREPIVAYRLTTPVVAWLLHVQGWGAVAIQYVALILTFAVLYLATQVRLGRATALLTCVALAMTYVTQWTNFHPGYPDSVSHLAIALALLSPHTWILALSTLCGALNDERFVLAIPFIALWHIWNPHLRAAMREHGGVFVGILIGLLGVWLVRHALTVGWIGDGIVTPRPYTEAMEIIMLPLRPNRSTWGNFALSILLSFRWVWLLPLLAIPPWHAGTPRWIRLTIWGSTLLAALSTMIIWDVARSLAFIFPLMVMAAWWLAQRNPRGCQRLLAIVMILCILTPGLGFYNSVNRPRPFYPLPLVLIRTYLMPSSKSLPIRLPP